VYFVNFFAKNILLTHNIGPRRALGEECLQSFSGPFALFRLVLRLRVQNESKLWRVFSVVLVAIGHAGGLARTVFMFGLVPVVDGPGAKFSYIFFRGKSLSA
jgi:hypothetical protein